MPELRTKRKGTFFDFFIVGTGQPNFQKYVLEEGGREQEKGHQARGAKASQGHGVRVQCRQEKDAERAFRVARWGTKTEFKQASP